MSVFLATAAFIIMVAAPFLVMAAISAAIGFSLIALVRGFRTARPTYAVLGALVLIAGVTSGLTLLAWSTSVPPKGKTSSPHALVHHAWQQTRLRFGALRWMTDGTFERLERQDRQGR